jgi:hypothetical protein
MKFKIDTKTLIIIAMLSPFAKADMDFVCTIDVTWSKPFIKEDLELIENRMKIYKCERNNILQIRAVPYTGKDINLIVKNADFLTKNASEKRLLRLSNYFCRFDRNRDINHNTLSCVLYSPKAREFVKQN